MSLSKQQKDEEQVARAAGKNRQLKTLYLHCTTNMMTSMCSQQRSKHTGAAKSRGAKFSR